jgi:uncharacterized protein YjbI with pentapeptide repeats
MANQEHVDRLLQGVEEWNQWRKENPEISPDLYGADFSGATLINADFNGATLINADFNGADLSNTNLSNANLNGATLSNAILNNADLNRTHLRDATLSGATLINVNFSSADLSNTNFSGANLSNTNLSNAFLSGADLSGAKLSIANLNRTDLSNANLSNGNFTDADLTNANLTNANLSFANFSLANLSFADLKDVNLSSADLSGANLSGADLGGVNFSFANLVGANLSSADLRDVNLKDATFSFANLSFANLRDVNLSNAVFSRADLSDASLSNANLSNADLSNTDLNNADFSSVNLSNANLNNANLSGTNLSRANLNRTNLIDADLVDADLIEADLSNADLSGANLSNADLSGANLSNADLSGANLSNADLNAVQALNTNFQAATLTGACTEDWNINSGTNLQEVICKHIFIEYDWQKHQFVNRRPHDPNQIFAPGEFTKRYQIVLETVDLFFNDGIDWKAFLDSLQDLRTQYGDELNIQGIEKKTGGSFVVRLEVPSDADKGTVEQDVKALYEIKFQILEAKYHAELQAKDQEIEIYKQQSADILELAKLAASRPINVEAKAVAENQSKNTTYNQQNSKWGGGFAAEGGIQIGGQFIDASSKQNLTEAAQEIQQLLDHLSKHYPTTTSTERMMVAAKAVEEIEKNPVLKQRVIGALKAGGIEALKELVDHPAINILLATIEGWQNPT